MGGFSLSAAEHVGGEAARRGGSQETDDSSLPPIRLAAPLSDRGKLSPPSVLDGIVSLVEKSLLRQVGAPLADEPRYQMLETVREFGLERLAASGEERDAREAHASYLLSVAEPAREQLFAPGYERVLARLDIEHDNVRAALVWAEAAGETELGLRLARAMSHFWSLRGHYREGRHWLTRALAQGDGAPTAARIRALLAAGYLARSQDDTEEAEALMTEALVSARASGDDEATAKALQALGQVAAYGGDFEQAAAWTEEARTLFEQLETTTPAGRQFVSLASMHLGQIARGRGDLDEAATDSLLGPALRPAQYPTGDGSEPGVEFSIDQASFHEVFAADLPAETAAIMAVSQRPGSAVGFGEPSGVPGWKTLPSWAVVATADKTIGVTGERLMAHCAGAITVEVDASHVVMISQPAAVADLIRTAVGSLS